MQMVRLHEVYKQQLDAMAKQYESVQRLLMESHRSQMARIKAKYQKQIRRRKQIQLRQQSRASQLLQQQQQQQLQHPLILSRNDMQQALSKPHLVSLSSTTKSIANRTVRKRNGVTTSSKRNNIIGNINRQSNQLQLQGGRHRQTFINDGMNQIQSAIHNASILHSNNNNISIIDNNTNMTTNSNIRNNDRNYNGKRIIRGVYNRNHSDYRNTTGDNINGGSVNTNMNSNISNVNINSISSDVPRVNPVLQMRSKFGMNLNFDSIGTSNAHGNGNGNVNANSVGSHNHQIIANGTDIDRKGNINVNLSQFGQQLQSQLSQSRNAIGNVIGVVGAAASNINNLGSDSAINVNINDIRLNGGHITDAYSNPDQSQLPSSRSQSHMQPPVESNNLPSQSQLSQLQTQLQPQQSQAQPVQFALPARLKINTTEINNGDIHGIVSSLQGSSAHQSQNSQISQVSQVSQVSQASQHGNININGSQLPPLPMVPLRSNADANINGGMNIINNSENINNSNNNNNNNNNTNNVIVNSVANQSNVSMVSSRVVKRKPKLQTSSKRVLNKTGNIKRTNSRNASRIVEKRLVSRQNSCKDRYIVDISDDSTSIVSRSSRNLKIGQQFIGHQCDQCPQIFSTQHELMAHQAIHMGEKPFQCQKCKKKFANIEGYQCHMPVCAIS